MPQITYRLEVHVPRDFQYVVNLSNLCPESILEAISEAYNTMKKDPFLKGYTDKIILTEIIDGKIQEELSSDLEALMCTLSQNSIFSKV